MSEERRKPAELKGRGHIEIHVGPAGEEGIDYPHQPVLARVTLHTDTDRAAAPARIVLENDGPVFELRKHPVGEAQQIIARWR